MVYSNNKLRGGYYYYLCNDLFLYVKKKSATKSNLKALIELNKAYIRFIPDFGKAGK
jgi:hypothetical protein